MKAETTYRGYTITIYLEEDSYHLNPYEWEDGMPPMMVNGGRHLRSHNYYNAAEAIDPTRAQYRRHKRALWDAIGEDPDGIEAGAWTTKAEEQEERFREVLQDARDNMDLELLAAVADVLGIPCLHTSSHGYSQGDYVELLVVWSEEYEKRTGVTKDMAAKDGCKLLKDSARYWSAWAWGDVYGWTVEDANGEHVDGCGGYICPDGDTDYLEAEARAVVDHHRARIVKEHVAKVKGWIRGRAPLYAREPLTLPAAV